MEQIGIERLAALELPFLRNDDALLRDAEIGLIPVCRLDGANPEIIRYYPVHRLEAEHRI